MIFKQIGTDFSGCLWVSLDLRGMNGRNSVLAALERTSFALLDLHRV